MTAVLRGSATRAIRTARNALLRSPAVTRAVMMDAQSGRGTVSTQPLTPWAHLISEAKLQQQREAFAEPLEFRVSALPTC